MPLFVLYGGEIVFLIVGLRIALWLLRGGVYREGGAGDGPPRGGGRPAPVVAIDAARRVAPPAAATERDAA